MLTAYGLGNVVDGLGASHGSCEIIDCLFLPYGFYLVQCGNKEVMGETLGGFRAIDGFVDIGRLLFKCTV